MAKPKLPLYQTPTGRKSPKLSRLQKKIRDLEEEQEPLKKKLGPSLAGHVTRFLKTGKYPVVVPVTDGHCGVCRVKLPAQAVRDLEDGAIIECAQCARLLYTPMEEIT